MTSDKNFFLVMARIIIAMIKDIPKKLRLSFRSKAGSEKNILLFSQFPQKFCENWNLFNFYIFLAFDARRDFLP